MTVEEWDKIRSEIDSDYVVFLIAFCLLELWIKCRNENYQEGLDSIYNHYCRVKEKEYREDVRKEEEKAVDEYLESLGDNQPPHL